MLSLGLCKAQFSFTTWFPVSVNRHRERPERWRENSSWPTPYTTVDSSFFHFSHTPKNNISAPLPGDITTLAAWYPVLRGPAPSLPVDSLLILQAVNIHSRGFLTKFWVPDICGPQSNYTYKWASFFLETLIPARWSPSHPSLYSSSVFQAASLLKIPEFQFWKALPPIFQILMPNLCLLLCSQSSHFLQPLWLISVFVHLINSPISGY